MLSRRFIIRTAIGLGAAAVIFLFVLSPGVFLFRLLWYAKGAKIRLLCETDHEALLQACRLLSARVKAGDLKPGKYGVHFNTAPEAASFPRELLDLSPGYVYIDPDGRVAVEMLGGLGHFGVVAYPEDFKASLSGFRYGDRKLIDGLWYHDDGYANNPAYDEKIKAILRKCGRLAH